MSEEKKPPPGMVNWESTEDAMLVGEDDPTPDIADTTEGLGGKRDTIPAPPPMPPAVTKPDSPLAKWAKQAKGG